MEKTIELLIIVMLLGIMAEIYLTTRPQKTLVSSGTGPIMLVDTSVLIDGRVVDLAKTGFLLGQVVVPRSVLAELQLLADGGDHAKRERARFGMDSMKELKDVLGGSFTLFEDERRTPEGVDSRLLTLAKQMKAAILTIDYNLNKVAQVEGVKVLNINELAKSLRMSYLPGDELELELVQKGQDSHQAVGYLRDGTMVVVEQAKKMIGQTKKVEIIRSLQTDAGKMMFAKLTEVKPEHQPQNQRRSSPKQQMTRGKATQPAPVKNGNNRRPKTSAQHEAELIRLVDKQ